MPRKLPSHLLFHHTHPRILATPGGNPPILYELPIPLNAHSTIRGTRSTRNPHFRCAIPARSSTCPTLVSALRDFLNDYTPIVRPDSEPLHALPLYVSHGGSIQYSGYIDLTDHDLIHFSHFGPPRLPNFLFQTTLRELYDALDAYTSAALQSTRPVRRVPPAV